MRWARSTRITPPGRRRLQRVTAYVDTRGFAGRLSQHGDVFEWQRLIDIEPPAPFPDAGRMRWEAHVLIEVGVHTDYVEHWVRQDGHAEPCWALFASKAILLRVGAQFGWADRSGVVLYAIGGPLWAALNPHVDRSDLLANGGRWSIEDSEGDVDLWVAQRHSRRCRTSTSAGCVRRTWRSASGWRARSARRPTRSGSST